MAAPLDRIVRLFRAWSGADPAAVQRVAADGSARSYHRLVGPAGRTAIGGYGADPDENRAFLSFSRSFADLGLPVPEIYGADEGAGVWLMEDLGSTTLFDALVQARGRSRAAALPAAIEASYRQVLEILPRFQVEGGKAIDFGVAYPHAAFDGQSIEWDLNYFKYHFLKLAHIPFHEARLERDFDALIAFLLEAPAEHFLYRDFQSRNVMLRDGAPWFVDYQGGRRGALQYDVASLLWDAKADLPDDAREALLEHYLAALARLALVDAGEFRRRYPGFVLVRIMQAMGAYGYRGFFERKPRFLQSVPYAAQNLHRVLEAGLPLPLPEVEVALRRIVEAWAPETPAREAPAGFTVDVSSFSFRHGYPEDTAGHGGGFVFDCRALPNPGRLAEYAALSGRDTRVVDYLTAQAAWEPFWSSVRNLVAGQIEEYVRRGFGSLSVAFGCTGGQHRSVALAERLAGHLRERFPEVQVRLIHREEPVWGRPAAPAEAARSTPA